MQRKLVISFIYVNHNQQNRVIHSLFLHIDTPNMKANSTTEANTLAEYKLSKIIGEGTFGKVHLAIHIPTGEKVAIKVLQKDKIVDQADIERVTREICILKILRHPNVAQLYEIIQTKHSIHLIMEYAQGGELFEHIVKKRRLNEKEAVRFMQQLLAGVEYIHRNGIVHRDLKPENLLLDEKGNIKIVDFGLSNQYSIGEKLKTACGSPCYAAPEMIAGKYYECCGVDVWSCGIILFAMLCGYLPFEDQNTNKLYKKILSGDLHLPKYLSQESKAILRGILNVNPERRLKIGQIRETKWYQQIGAQYIAKGIMVGKDPIEVNESIFKRIQALGYETTLLKEDLSKNKHNYLTTLYYLIKVKLERNEGSEAKSAKVISSPKGTSPPKMQPKKETFFMPKTTFVQKNRSDSLNATNIISSLVQANKTVLVSPNSTKPQRVNNFIRPNDFKTFPKQLQLQTEPSDSNRADSKSIPSARLQSETREPSKKVPVMTHNRTNSSSSHNPQRQQMVHAIRQIPHKINNQIQLNQTTNQPNLKQVPQQQLLHKAQQLSPQAFPKRINNTTSTKMYPFIHSGPFNSNCLFMDSPGNLFLKIITFLRKNNISCKQNDHFTLSLHQNHFISIESFQGIAGYFLVKFTPFSPLSERIITCLSE